MFVTTRDRRSCAHQTKAPPKVSSLGLALPCFMLRRRRGFLPRQYMLALPQTSTEAAASRGDVPTVADESPFSHLKPRFISRRSIPSINILIILPGLFCLAHRLSLSSCIQPPSVLLRCDCNAMPYKPNQPSLESERERERERKRERQREMERERERDREIERWRDGEIERWRDGEMERWRDGEIER